jgi:hypothetical protein
MRKVIIGGKFIGLFVVEHMDFGVIDEMFQALRRMNRKVFLTSGN